MKSQALKQAKLGRPVNPERVEAKRLTILRAAAAGITKGTAYHYFGSKEKLFLSTAI